MKVQSKKGFTLIELIVVIVIIGILAAVAVPAFVNLIDQAKAGATKGALGAIRSAVVLTYAERVAGGTDAYPTSITTDMFRDLKIPKNPIADNNVTAGATAGATDATAGWLYNSSNGQVWATMNSTEATKPAYTDFTDW